MNHFLISLVILSERIMKIVLIADYCNMGVVLIGTMHKMHKAQDSLQKF